MVRKSQLSIIILIILIVITSLCIYLVWRKNDFGAEPYQEVILQGEIENAQPTEAQPPSKTPMIKNLEEDVLASFVEETDKVIIPASIPMRMRIAEEIDTLKKESLKDSLTLLSEIEMFEWPGVSEGLQILRFPFDREIGQTEVDKVLSNRRFLKLYQELSELPEAEASALINSEIEKCLLEYVAMFENTWKDCLTSRKNNPVDGLPYYASGPMLKISNNPDHSPTMAGMRLKILSLLVLSGNLDLQNSSDAVQKVLSEALQQRERFYDEQGGLEGDRFTMLTRIGIYNRQILATAYLGVNRSDQWHKEDSWKTYKLTAYDAEFTPYDLMTRYGGPLPADYSKGTQSIKVHVPLDDAEFDSLISAK